MRVVVLLLVVLSLVSFAACTPDATDSRPLLLVTFYPLADITSAIVGEDVRVVSLVPSGVEPHDYELTPQNLRDASEAAAFVTLGLSFSPLEERVVASSRPPTAVDAGQRLTLLDATDAPNGNELEEGRGKDPHVWLSPTNMQTMTDNVVAGLVAAFPERKTVFETRATAYKARLGELDTEFKSGLASCAKDTIIVNHAAFAYLAHDYGFTQVAISGLEPEADVSPSVLRRVIEEAKANDVKHVFYEELADPRLVQTIASDIGATPLELSPIEGTRNPGDDYVSMMRRNLVNLRIALDCR